MSIDCIWLLLQQVTLESALESRPLCHP